MGERRWPRRTLAVTVEAAVIVTAGRLLADALFPPHARWWFSPVVALVASLITSLLWAVNGRRRRG